MAQYVDDEASEDSTYDYEDDDGGEDSDEPIETVLKEPKTEKITANRICDWCIKRGAAAPRTKVKNTNLCSKHLQEYNEKLSGEWARKQAQKEVDKKKRQLLKEKERAKLTAAKNKRYAETRPQEKKKIAKINDDAAIHGIAFMNDISYDQAAELYYAARVSPQGSRGSSQRSSRNVSDDESESESESEAEETSLKQPVRAEAVDVPATVDPSMKMMRDIAAQLALFGEELRRTREHNLRVEALVNDPRHAAKVLNQARANKTAAKVVPIDPMNLEAREESIDKNENNIGSGVGSFVPLEGAAEPPVDIMT